MAWTRKGARPGAAGRPACCMAIAPICYRTDGQISDPLHFRRSRLSRIGQERNWLNDLSRVNYVSATDREAVDAFHRLTRLEGVIPAWKRLTPGLCQPLGATLPKDHVSIVCLAAGTRT